MKDLQDRYSTMLRRASRRADQCPPGEALAALSAGRVWSWQRRRLIEHIGCCSDCADDYRVLTMARAGLIDALETHAGDVPDNVSNWLRPGLAAIALAGFTALAIAVLVGTGGPGAWSEPDMIAANGVESRQGRHKAVAPGEDRVFKSDFGEPSQVDGPLFRDDFGG